MVEVDVAVAEAIEVLGSSYSAGDTCGPCPYVIFAAEEPAALRLTQRQQRHSCLQW